MKNSIFRHLAVLLAAVMITAVPEGAAVKEVRAETEKRNPEEQKSLGEKTQDGYSARIKNRTGCLIVGAAVRSVDEESFGENLLKEGDALQKEEERMFYCPKPPENAGAGDEKLFYPGYDLQIVFEDNTACVIHGFPFDDLADSYAEILLEDGTGYLVYESIRMNGRVNTLETEQAARDIESRRQKSQ